MLDGVDECEGDREQVEIILLVSRFVIQHPDAPILWVIASRLEPHIRSVFSRSVAEPTFYEGNVPIDSDEACKDVEVYLRHAFEEIRGNYPECFSTETQWPTEIQLLKLSTSAVGLFAFAATVVRFVGDSETGNPVSQLEEVLVVTDKTSAEHDAKRTANPLSTLDALYARILSMVPKDTLPTTMSILAHRGWLSFRHLSNFLGLRQSDV